MPRSIDIHIISGIGPILFIAAHAEHRTVDQLDHDEAALAARSSQSGKKTRVRVDLPCNLDSLLKI